MDLKVISVIVVFCGYPHRLANGRSGRDFLSHAGPAVMLVLKRLRVVVFPATAEGLLVQLGFKQDGTRVAPGMVGQLHGEDGSTAHSAVAKLVHVTWV
jgi:hypothetical protein